MPGEWAAIACTVRGLPVVCTTSAEPGDIADSTPGEHTCATCSSVKTQTMRMSASLAMS
jgi:hypothetical protein